MKEKKNYQNMVIQQKKNIKYLKSNNLKKIKIFNQENWFIKKLDFDYSPDLKISKKRFYRFHRLLKRIFKNPEAYRNKFKIITKLNKKYYLRLNPNYTLLNINRRYFFNSIIFYNLKYIKYFKRRYLYKFYWFRKTYMRIFNRIFKILFIKYLNVYKLNFIKNVYINNNLLFYKKKLKKIKKIKKIRKIKYMKYKLKKINKFDKLIMINFLLNNLFINGKKKKSYNIFFNLLLLLKYKYKISIFKILYKSICNVRPLINFKTMYIGGKKYKIPVPLNYIKSYRLSLKWIIKCSKDINKKNYILNLLSEIMDSFNNNSNSVKKRKEFHLLAYENKSYIRFLRFLKS